MLQLLLCQSLSSIHIYNNNNHKWLIIIAEKLASAWYPAIKSGRKLSSVRSSVKQITGRRLLSEEEQAWLSKVKFRFQV